jgi:NAD(P)-dependent dehydrogenase (short-subunit alcohol dehydrogenase family)
VLALAVSVLFDLTGRTAVVTGGLGKLGPIWAAALLEAGASVAALDLPGARPSPAFASLVERHGNRQLCVYPADVTDRASLREALAACSRELGEPTILVNNAGIDQPPTVAGGSSPSGHPLGLEGPATPAPSRHRWHDIPAEVCRRILEVNLVGAFMTTQVFAAPMARARRGSIINIGSLYASVSPDARLYDHLSGPGDEAPFIKPPFYGASKAGVVNLSRYLATHLAPHGIRVNALSPGGVLGGQDEEFKRKFSARVPLGRMAAEGDLKGPLLFLASDASAYVTGTELLVDGGFTAW